MSDPYAILAARCLECEGNGEKVMRVTMKFKNEEELSLASDMMFDEVYGSFNNGLSKGWFVDEIPEISRIISHAEATKIGYVTYDPNLL